MYATKIYSRITVLIHHISFFNRNNEQQELALKKLSAFKFESPFRFSTSSSTFSLQNQKPISFQCREQTTDHGIQTPLSHHPNPEISGFYQKGFSEITNHIVGRALHGVCLKGYTHLGTFHTNTLISMYSKFGKIEAALYLFEEMPWRNSASWNTLMSGLVRAGLYQDAIGFFCEMRFFGIDPSGFVIASFVTACNRCGDMIREGFQIHGLVVKTGLVDDVFVGSSLVHFYGTYVLASCAQRLFNEMPERNIVSWTSLMVGYSNNEDHGEVLRIYQRMRREEVRCNQNSFSTLISSCGFLEDDMLGAQVLGDIIKSAFEDNVSVGNSLIWMFGSFSCIKEALYVFGRMSDRDTISWNSMIFAYVHNGFCEETFRCFCSMRRVHGEIDSTTLSTLLSVCNSVDQLKWGRGIHGLIVKLGLASNICVCNTLLTMYSDAGSSRDAKELFLGMQQRDLISWNSMMSGYVQDRKGLDALRVFNELLKMGKMVNYVTFASALAACSNSQCIAEGKIVHALVVLFGLHENLIVGNALVTMYGKCGMLGEANQVFQNMPEKDLVSWNSLIGSYAEIEEPEESLKIFKLMREKGEAANYITMVNVLGVWSASNSLLKHGMPLHGHILLTGFESDDYVKNSLITMYAKCGDLNSSNYIFNGLVNKDTVTWNAMVAANAHHGHGEEALKLFSEMQRVKVDLDQFSFSAALCASANLAILEEGQQLHSLAMKLGFESYLYVTNATMDMYGKCGDMDDVVKMLPNSNSRSRLSWNILISALARHGSFRKAIATFHEMVKTGVKPDHVTFVSLLSACSHGGLVDEGLSHFASMTNEFGVPAEIEHCVCMIDLLGRSGRLIEAEAFITKMPVPPNDFVWRSLLAACRIHGNLELGKKAAQHLLESNPSDDSAYVLYSNVCATTGRWDYVENVRGHMESSNIKKQPACSWVKLKNEVSSFGIGDKSHPQTEGIYAKLEILRKLIKEAGYVPDTTFALHDTDEEQKEHNLWNHSERLALAYGLISAPEGSTLRIFKNLRVCGDCHSVYKFASGIIRREIVLRDPYRFHHFKNGICSCGDFW